MVSIPIVKWNEKHEDTTRFDNFRVIGDPEIIQSLSRKMADITVDQHSDNILIIALVEITENEEWYRLSIDKQNIRLESNSLQGLSSGLSTLKMMLFPNSNVINHGVIEEYPAFKNRGVFLDVSRGKMPTMEYLKDLVSFMSDLKYNILQLYSEDKLALPSDPTVGMVTGVYTEENIKELDSWCKEHFIELQPCLQTYSHLYGILTLPEYEHLSENENLFSMAAGNEDVYDFFEREFSQVLPWFSSKTVNINMDEAYDLGSGYTKEAVAKDGKGQVYLNHIQRIYDLTKKYGAKKVIIWGDIALKYGELLNSLPEDIIVADWNYNPLKEFATLETLSKANTEFWAGGGVSTWNSLFPRVYNSYTNLRYYSSEAYEKGATGFLVTDWGDYGHAQSLGLSLYGYMLGAHQSYNALLTEVKDLENNTFPLIFKDKRVEEAFKLLMDSNLAENLETDFKTMSIYYLFDDIFDGLSMNGNENYPKLTKNTFVTLASTGNEAYTRLEEVSNEIEDYEAKFTEGAWRNLFGGMYISELMLSARTTKYVGKKGLLSLQIKDSFKAGTVTPKEILTYIIELKKLYKEFLQIRSKFEETWVHRSYLDSIETNLMIFDKAGVQFGKSVAWLSEQYRKARNNEPVDRNMETYTAGKEYKILWTADYKDMWERAYPWQ